MDEQQIDQDLSGENHVSLGAGVDILQAKDADDVEFETFNDDSVSSDEMTPQEQLKRLRQKLAESNAAKQEYMDGWQRLKADFVNYKRREDENKQEFLKYSREEIITDLLPVLESFRMAFANKAAWEKVDPSWRSGVEHIHTQLLQVLVGHGLTEVNPIGERFDPNAHTAVETVPTANPAEAHCIAEVLQVGYRLNGKLIRSPRVKVFGEAGEHATPATLHE
jgi:molecular chaperone GrpE